MLEIFDLFKINNVLDMEVAKLSYIFSLVISLLVYHKRSNLPGAIIVPGSLLLLAGNPLELLIVIFSILLTFISNYLIQKYILKDKIFSAKEKILILTSLSLFFTITIYALLDIFFQSVVFGIIGIVASGMIAERIDRPNNIELLKSFAISMSLTLVSYVSFKFLAHHLLPTFYIDFLNNHFDIKGLNKISSIAMYILFLVAITVNFTFSKYHNFKFAGLIIGTYLGILFFHPLYLLITISSILVGYLVLSYLSNYTFLYGFRSFVMAMLVCSSTFSLIQHLISYFFDYKFSVFFGMNIAIFAFCGITVQSLLHDGIKNYFKSALIMNAFIVPVIFVMLFFSHLHGWDLSFI